MKNIYSPALTANGFVFCSGVLGKKKDGELSKGFEEQLKQALQNLEEVLKRSEVAVSDVVKVEVYLKDMNDFEVLNREYLNTFSFEPKPARVTVEVARLPMDALVEISCVAVTKHHND